jgi:hypothetical protein
MDGGKAGTFPSGADSAGEDESRSGVVGGVDGGGIEEGGFTNLVLGVAMICWPSGAAS